MNLIDYNLTPPSWLQQSLCYVTLMGSRAYGASCDISDYDYYGFCIPPKKFVYLQDVIYGYDEVEKFEEFQQKGRIIDKTIYEFTIFNITKYFKLLEQNNPNILESLFTEERDVKYRSGISIYVRQNRNLFLSCQAIPRFLGYAISQKNRYLIDQTYKPKAAYHTVRLLLEGEEIITNQSLTLSKNNQLLLDIRNQKVRREDVLKIIEEKEQYLKETKFKDINLPEKPDHVKIRELLVDCLDCFYRGHKTGGADC
jgi:predicted nucleotidyltransferase